MTSLYRRASLPQAMVLRIIEGAVKNAQHAHPELQISPRHRRSIAKRATGTLSACWPAVLALPKAKARRTGSEWPEDSGTKSSAEVGAIPANRANHRGSPGSASAAAPVETIDGWRRRAVTYRHQIGLWIRDARKAGNLERAEALIDVMRLMSGKRKP